MNIVREILELATELNIMQQYLYLTFLWSADDFRCHCDRQRAPCELRHTFVQMNSESVHFSLPNYLTLIPWPIQKELMPPDNLQPMGQ